MIEHVYNIVTSLAQFIFILWPLFTITAFAYSFQGIGGKRWIRALGRQIHLNLLITWLILFLVWMITLFASRPTPSLVPEPFNSIAFFLGLFIVISIQVNRFRWLPLKISARMDLQEAQKVEYLRRMNPTHFEELVAETYRALGYQATRTGQTGDHGIDVEVLTPKGNRWIVQCKRYRDSVGEAVVRELYGTMVSEKANRGVLVTSAEITAPAENWAKGKPIDLIDGQQFLMLIEEARKKSQGSLFDRLVRWFGQYSHAQSIPNGLRSKGVSDPASDQFEQTKPTRVRSPIPTVDKKSPICPNCGIPMIEHPRHPERNLFRCVNYPKCRIVVDRS